MENKITKRDYFGMIRTMIEGSGVENEDEILGFIDKEVAVLDARAEKAKERAAKKREESDELRQAIFEVLTDEGQTVADIVDKLDREDITRQKIVARLTQLIKDGKVQKDTAKTEDKKKVTIYMVAAAE